MVFQSFLHELCTLTVCASRILRVGRVHGQARWPRVFPPDAGTPAHVTTTHCLTHVSLHGPGSRQSFVLIETRRFAWQSSFGGSYGRLPNAHPSARSCNHLPFSKRACDLANALVNQRCCKLRPFYEVNTGRWVTLSHKMFAPRYAFQHSTRIPHSTRLPHGAQR